MYEKEGILVSDNEETAIFSVFHHPKTVADDTNVFPSVGRIPNLMLCKVDPSHLVLVSYLKTINPDIETGVLFTTTTSSFKKKKGSMKVVKEPSYIQQPDQVEKVVKAAKNKKVHTEPPPVVAHKTFSKSDKEVIPSQSGMLKKLKKMAGLWILLQILSLILLRRIFQII